MCPSQQASNDDYPAVLWVVARREDGTGRPLYYVGSGRGWTEHLQGASIWPTVTWATAVAALFEGAIPVRVLIWAPLDPVPSGEDMISLLDDE